MLRCPSNRKCQITDQTIRTWHLYITIASTASPKLDSALDRSFYGETGVRRQDRTLQTYSGEEVCVPPGARCAQACGTTAQSRVSSRVVMARRPAYIPRISAVATMEVRTPTRVSGAEKGTARRWASLHRRRAASGGMRRSE
jgi:hypothetical protein